MMRPRRGLGRKKKSPRAGGGGREGGGDDAAAEAEALASTATLLDAPLLKGPEGRQAQVEVVCVDVGRVALADCEEEVVLWMKSPSLPFMDTVPSFQWLLGSSGVGS